MLHGICRKKHYTMKKILLIVAIAAASLTASAQTYVGGSVGFWRNSDKNSTNVTIHPEIGYNLSNKWALGLGIGYTYDYTKGRKRHDFTIDPYARWSYAKFGSVSLFLDMGFGINPVKYKGDDDSQVAWRVGVQPGLQVSLTKKIDFVAHVGFLGYREGDGSNYSYGKQGFGFNVDGNNLMFGIEYNF